MAEFVCERCGTDIAGSDERLTLRVVINRPDDRETLSTVRLCEACSADVEDHLTLETTRHEPV